MAATRAGKALPRTMRCSSVPAADTSGATYPMAMGPFTVGPKPPDVTTPTSRPSGVAIGVPSRAGALPSGFNPTRTRAGPSASSRWIRAAPGKPPSVRRRFWIDHVSPASTGEVVEVNGELEGAPGAINEDPAGKGWFLKLKLKNPSELEGLMTEEQYREYVASL